MIVRPTVVAGIIGATFPRRNEMALYGLQIVSRGGVEWAEKPMWFRNVPYTAVHPTLGQLETRIHFGELASAAKGTKGLQTVTTGPSAGKRLPGAAKTIAERMPGYRAPNRLEPTEYPSKLRRTLHTLEELRALAAKKSATA
jgi:hypothetical protein